MRDWKYYLGLVLFVYSFMPIVVVAALPFLGLTVGESGAFAVVFLTSITNGMILLGIGIYTQNIVSGVILVVALSLDRLRALQL